MTRLLFALLLVAICALPALATTEETEESAQDTTSTPAGKVDLLPQISLGDRDTFGPVSNTDPLDFGHTDTDPEILTIIFWVDPLNGSWIGEPGVPVGPPPYQVFVGGVPEGSCKFDPDWNEPEAVPLLKNEDGSASPDNIGWVLKVKRFGKMRLYLRIIASDGSSASGNIVQCARCYTGGQKCGYAFEHHKDGTVTAQREDKKTKKATASK